MKYFLNFLFGDLAAIHHFDGFKLCRLTATDYYETDEHPNRAGYAKIASCTTDVINKMAAQLQ